MKIKKLWFILCMTVTCFTITSCIKISEETQQRIDVLLEKQVALKTQLEKAIDDHKQGKLTTAELLVLKDDLTENIVETRDEVLKLKEEGVGYGEMALAVVGGVLSRGLPSKGPLPRLLNGMFAMFRNPKED